MGFQYRYNSDKPAYLQVAYSTAEMIYEYPHPGYEHYNVYTHAPLTAVNTANINAHKDPLMSDSALSLAVVKRYAAQYCG